MASKPQLTENHLLALKHCASLLRNAKDDWWIIGSTAIALHGIDVGPIKDIDILVSRRDAQALLLATGEANQATARANKFRSDIFLVLDKNCIPLEFMAGLSVNVHGNWQNIAPITRQTIKTGNSRIFTPALSELVEILRVFDREKDHHRIALIARNDT